MSAPDGRHSLSGAVPATRSHRRDVLAARLDETGRDPVWRPGLGEVCDRLAVKRRDMRLDRMWQRTGPGRRDRWAAAIARDFYTQGMHGAVTVDEYGVGVHVAGTSAAEIVARQVPRLVPPPAGLLKGAAVEVERTVREAEEVLGRAVKAAPKVADSIARYLAQQHTGHRPRGGDQ